MISVLQISETEHEVRLQLLLSHMVGHDIACVLSHPALLELIVEVTHTEDLSMKNSLEASYQISAVLKMLG